MEKRNVTLCLPDSLLKRAKITAAKAEKSLSHLMKEAIEEKINKDTGYKKAGRRHLKVLNTGFDLGTKGNLKSSREELHERR